MRRIWLACIVWMSLSSAAAWAAGPGLVPRTRLAATRTSAAQILFGNHAIEPFPVAAIPGRTEAVSFADATSGSAWMITLFADARSRAKGLSVGLYSTRNGRPGMLVAAGRRSSLKPGAWNVVMIPRMNVRAGSMYWIGILANGGSLYLRSARGAGCGTPSFSRRNLRFMPAAWTGTQRWSVCRISAYVSGDAANIVPPPPGECAGVFAVSAVISARHAHHVADASRAFSAGE